MLVSCGIEKIILIVVQILIGQEVAASGNSGEGKNRATLDPLEKIDWNVSNFIYFNEYLTKYNLDTKNIYKF